MVTASPGVSHVRLTWTLEFTWPGPRRNVIRVSKVRRHEVARRTKLLLTRPLSASGFSLRLLCFRALSPFHSRLSFRRTQHCLCRRGVIVHSILTNAPPVSSTTPLISHVLWPQNASSDKGVRKSTRQQCRSFSEPSEGPTRSKSAPQWLPSCHPSAV